MFVIPMTRSTAFSSRQLARSLNQFFNDGLQSRPEPSQGASSDGGEGGVEGAHKPRLDVTENATAYTVHMDLPGVGKGDVRVSVDGRRVTVQAQAQGTPAPDDTKPATDKLIHRERLAAHYARSFVLPTELDEADVNAKLEHGVLALTLPKRTLKTASKITVN